MVTFFVGFIAFGFGFLAGIWVTYLIIIKELRRAR